MKGISFFLEKINQLVATHYYFDYNVGRKDDFMIIKEALNCDHVLAHFVPLSIPNIGIAYLNDIGLWNITINTNDEHVSKQGILNKDLQYLIINHSKSHELHLFDFEERKNKLIDTLKQYDDNQLFTLL